MFVSLNKLNITDIVMENEDMLQLNSKKTGK
jgi:hypothetical protein